MTMVQAQVVCEYTPDEGRRLRLLYADKDDECGVFLADAWDGEDWVESTPEELEEITVACLYEFWQKLRTFKNVD